MIPPLFCLIILIFVYFVYGVDGCEDGEEVLAGWTLEGRCWSFRWQ